MKWAVILAGAAALATIAGVAWTIYHDRQRDAIDAAKTKQATKRDFNPYPGRVQPNAPRSI